MNGHMLPQGGAHSLSYMPLLQQNTHSVTSLKDSTNQQVFFCVFTLLSFCTPSSYAEDVFLLYILFDACAFYHAICGSQILL